MKEKRQLPVELSRKEMALRFAKAFFALLSGLSLVYLIEWRYALDLIVLLCIGVAACVISLVSSQCYRMSHLSKTARAFLIVLSCALSFSLVVGTNIEITEATNISRPKTIFLFIALVPGLVFGLGALCIKLNESKLVSNSMIHLEKNCLKRITLLSAITIFCAWIPVFLAFYPGIYGYDSIYQTQEVLGGSGISSCNPVIHTLFLCGSIAFGRELFFSDSIGFALGIVIQMLILALAFGMLCSRVMKISHSRVIFAISLIWFALCPLNSILAISSTKDVLFTAFFCIAGALVLDGAVGWRSRQKILFVVAASLALLLRNNAIYAYVVLIALVILYCAVKGFSGRAGRTTLVILAPLLISLLVSGPVYSLLGIGNPIAERDSLSVPLQQLARTRILHGDDLTKRQTNFIDELISGWKGYEPGISDHVKSSFDRPYFLEHKAEFVENYISIGLAHPKTYLDSFLLNTYGYWYPNMNKLSQGGWSYHPFLEVKNTPRSAGDQFLYIDTGSKIPPLRDFLMKVVSDRSWEKMPILATIMNPGAQIWFYIIALFILATGKRLSIDIAAPTLFLIAYWLTCLLGPCLLVRYIYPLYAFLPILLAALVGNQRSSREMEAPSYSHATEQE